MDTTKPAEAGPNIKTRFLVISDTHGLDFSQKDKPLNSIDVAIHCGDLTDGSKLDEFRIAIKLLRDIDAPLKLVIAGNHDFTMDIPAFERKIAEATPSLDSDLVVKEYGAHGEARQLFEEEKDAGLVFLDQGTHRFTLQNGALLTVYASPYTPALGAWGFQYHPNRGHDFSIGKGVDLVMTHGPPKGIMDYTYGRERAGCPNLFAAVARARPQLHCFGHIHEGWGAKLVTWRDEPSENPTHFTDIDNERSIVIEKLADLKKSRFDTPENVDAKLKKVERYNHERCCATSHCTRDSDPLECGSQTLFVNAAISGAEDLPVQKPWLVDIELQKAPARDLMTLPVKEEKQKEEKQKEEKQKEEKQKEEKQKEEKQKEEKQKEEKQKLEKKNFDEDGSIRPAKRRRVLTTRVIRSVLATYEVR
jgi:predicted phosphodiesterase